MKKIEKIIRREMLNMGADPAAKGFEYLVDAMELIFDNPKYLHNLVSLYICVGSFQKVRYTCIERCMRNLTQVKLAREGVIPWLKDQTKSFTLGNFLGSFYNYLLIKYDIEIEALADTDN